MRLLSVPLLLLACASPAAAQPHPPVHVPPIDVASGMSIEHSTAGAVVSLAGNVTRNVAILAEAGTSAGETALLAGGRIGTSFYYDGKPPAPGRFFAQFMAGTSILQAGAGADVIILPHSGISLHWSVDYRWARGAPPERSGTRVVVGILIGPRT